MDRGLAFLAPLPGAAIRAACLGAIAFLVGCASSSSSKLELLDSERRKPDQLMVVDCLLPGQVRKLGTQFTYLSPRRPIKTTARDCEIRGGEYVAYDRADYRTALKVWLPKAKEGDPKAQTYVGEIYERGLGGVPDYELAAQWYRKAAEQGHTRAQVNLGYLHEQGLGVEKNMVTALNWYRKASGLSNGLAYASSVQSAAQAAREARGKLEKLRQQVQKLQSRLARRRSQLEQAQAEMAELKDALEAQQEKSEQKKESTDQTHIEELRHKLEKREQQLQAERKEQAQLEHALKATREQLSSRLASAEQKRDRLRGELEDQQAAVARLRERLAQAREQGTEAADEQQRLKAQLEGAQERASALREQLAERKNAVADLQKQLTQAEQRAAEARQEVTALQEERNKLQARIEKLEKRLSQTGEVRAQRQRLKKRLEKRESEVARQREAIQNLEAKLAKLQQQGPSAPPSEDQGPTVEIIDPPLAVTRGSPSMRLRSPVEKLKVIGRVQPPKDLMAFRVNDRDRTQALDEEGLFQVQIPVNRQRTPVRMVAVDQSGKRAKLEFTVNPPDRDQGQAKVDRSDSIATPSGIDFGHYYALIIGNNSYPNLPDLETAINDARSVARTLKNKYGFQTQLLLDADRYQILSALNSLRKELTEQDNLLVYYAGHGELDKANARGYWLPVDAEADSTANWIANPAITDIVNVMAAKHVMVVADSCYSGTLTRSALARLQTGMTEEARKKWYKTMAKTRTRVVISSGGVKPVLDRGRGSNHSVFAKAFLEALRDNDTILEGYSLYRDVQQRVERRSASLPVEQDPRYAPIKHAGHEAGEFFFIPEQKVAQGSRPRLPGRSPLAKLAFP